MGSNVVIEVRDLQPSPLELSFAHQYVQDWSNFGSHESIAEKVLQVAENVTGLFRVDRSPVNSTLLLEL